MSKPTILITGGTGLVGSRLTDKLLGYKYEVSWLSRNKKNHRSDVTVYEWNITQNYIEQGALETADAIIHLAGAGVADEKWSQKRKQIIRDSRILSTKLLYDTLAASEHYRYSKHFPKVFIGASAIGIYGLNTENQFITEESPHTDDFLAQVTKDWETEMDKFEKLNIPVTKLRIGMVLSKHGGALEKLALPVKFGAGAALGSGKQYLSWIHIDDLCEMFVKALETNTMRGAYNAVAPHPITNIQMTQKIAKILNRPLFLPNVPEFVLKLGLGEMATIVTGGSRISSKKIEKTGFEFKYQTIDEALENLLK